MSLGHILAVAVKSLINTIERIQKVLNRFCKIKSRTLIKKNSIHRFDMLSFVCLRLKHISKYLKHSPINA